MIASCSLQDFSHRRALQSISHGRLLQKISHRRANVFIHDELLPHGCCKTRSRLWRGTLAAHGCCSDGRAAAGSATASSCSAGAPSAPVAAAPPLAPVATLLGGLAPVLPPAVFNLQEWATSLESGLERNEFCEHNLLVNFSWPLVPPAVVKKLAPHVQLVGSKVCK